MYVDKYVHNRNIQSLRQNVTIKEPINDIFFSFFQNDQIKNNQIGYHCFVFVAMVNIMKLG